MNLPSLPEFKSRLVSWATGKGWREAWARGSDVGGSSAAVSCPNPAQASAWVFACLRLVCDQLRSVPLELSTRDAKGNDLSYNDGETLAFWDMPAETASGRMSFGNFLELSATHIKLHGQAYWVLDDSYLSQRGAKSPILLARPDRMTSIMQGDTLVGWTLTDARKSRHLLLPWQVIRPRNLHPVNDDEGLSALAAARVAVDADYAAAVYQRNVAAANGDQGVYVIAKGGAALSPEQREQIIAQLRQKAELSRRGNYRPAFLTADVTVEDPKMKTVDAAFLDGRSASRDEIAVAFGVPPSMLQASTSQSIGRASDRFTFLENGVMPLAAKLCESMAEIERRRTGRILKFALNWNLHPVMRMAREESSKASVEMWRAGVPWKVLSDIHGLNLTPFAGWDASWLPMSLERVTDEGQGSQESQTSEDPPEANADDTTKLLTARASALAELRAKLMQPTCTAQKSCACGCQSRQPGQGVKGQEGQDSERVKLWKKHMTARRPSEKLMGSKISKAIMAARKETLAKLESSEKHLSGIRQRGVLDVIFDLAQFTISMVEGSKAAHKDTLEQAVFQFAEEIGASDPWKIEDTRLFTFLSKRESRIRDASRSIWDQIKAAIESGLTAGESNAEIANRVRTAFNGISKERADTIANTEVAAAYGFARHESMQGLGIEEKEWLASGLDTVRDSHRIADGQRVPVDEPFIINTPDGGTEQMMFPGDENGSAANVINCKCVSVAVMKD